MGDLGQGQGYFRPRSITIICCGGVSRAYGFYGAQEMLLPTIAAAVFDPVGQSIQRGTAIVGSDAVVDEPLVPALPVAIRPPVGAVVVVAAMAPILGVAGAPMVGVAARIADDDVAVDELENVGMLLPPAPMLVDVTAGDAVVGGLEDINELEDLEDINELEDIEPGMVVIGVSDGCPP